MEALTFGTLSGGETLFLEKGSSRHVRIHPAVLFSILDHYIRRDKKQVRVIGTLLGYVEGSAVEVTNCFAVVHREDENEEEFDVFLDEAFHKTMSALHQRVTPKEKIVGWYATTMNGSSIVNSSSLIHGFYAKECDDPIHLVVDTAMQGDSVGVKAFTSAPLTVNEGGVEWDGTGEEPAPGTQPITFANVFHQMKVVLHASEPERICIDRMLSGQQISEIGAGRGGGVGATGSGGEEGSSGGESSVTAESVSELTKELQGLEGSMSKLLEMVEVASDYVDKVVSGEIEADSETGRQIADTLATVPHIRPEDFDRIFNDNLQDLLMVSYLSSLTKSQLAVAERLNSII